MIKKFIAWGLSGVLMVGVAFGANKVSLKDSQKSTQVKKTLKIGIVRIADVFDSYQKTKHLDRILKENNQRRREKIEEMKSKLKKLEAKLQNKMLSMKKKMELEEEYEILKLKYKFYTKKVLREVEESQIKYTTNIFKDIREAIKEYGKKHHFDLILKQQEGDLKNFSMKDLQDEISLTFVLYYSPAIDITEDIIKMLNTAYEKQLKLLQKQKEIEQKNEKK